MGWELSGAAMKYCGYHNSTDKLLMLLLTEYANPDNHYCCWPAHSTLAERACCSVATVKNSLGRLEAAGFIERSSHPKANATPGRETVVWKVRLDNLSKQPDSSCDVAKFELPPSQNLAVTQPDSSYEYVNEYIKESVTEPDDMSSFDAWWELYPKKVDKHNAAKKFKLVPLGDLEHVMASTELLAAEWAERVAREGRQVLGFCKGPASWLLGRRWEDYPFESRSDRVSALVAEGAWSEVVGLLGVEVRVPWLGDPLWAGDVSALRERELKSEWWLSWWDREGKSLV